MSADESAGGQYRRILGEGMMSADLSLLTATNLYKAPAEHASCVNSIEYPQHDAGNKLKLSIQL